MQVYSSSPDFTPLFFITEFTKLQTIRRFWGRSILQLEMPISYEAVGFLQKNCWIVDDKDEPFIIRNITQNETTVTVVAYGGHWGFEGRITMPASGSYAIEKTGSADEIVKKFITDTLEGTKTERSLNINVAVARPVPVGELSISDQSRYKNLGDEVMRVLKNAGLGEKFRFNDGEITFDTYLGADNASKCVFDVRYKNIEKYEYNLDATSTQTTPIVGGGGGSAAREIVIAGDEESGWDRREVFVDARDIIDTVYADRMSKLQERATQAIITEEKKYSTTVATKANLTYNEDYHLGDFVSINVPIKTYEEVDGFFEPKTTIAKLKTRIIEVIETCDEGVETIELTFGDDVIKSDTTQLKSDVAQLKSVESAFPSGFIMMYAGTTAPFGYLLANGQLASRTTYSALFNAIGTTYGVGDGSTTFKLPDMRGKVVVGLSTETEFNALGKMGGEKTHVVTVAEMPSHNHNITTNNDDYNGTGGTGTIGPSFSQNNDSPSGVTLTNTSIISSKGSDQPHNNLQPYITLNYIIKY